MNLQDITWPVVVLVLGGGVLFVILVFILMGGQLTIEKGYKPQKQGRNEKANKK